MKFQLEPYSRNVPDDKLISDLQRVARDLADDYVGMEEYKKRGAFSAMTLIRRFGGWNKALLRAGLRIRKNMNTETEDYFENLKRVWIKLGRQPRFSEMRIPFSQLSGTAYLHKFGTWRTALAQFIEHVNQEENDVVQEVARETDHAIRRRTCRKPSLRLRFLVMRRDNFKCVRCGRSPATDAGVELVIDHDIAWSKGGETDFDNLVTLCRPCNAGKGNL